MVRQLGRGRSFHQVRLSQQRERHALSMGFNEQPIDPTDCSDQHSNRPGLYADRYRSEWDCLCHQPRRIIRRGAMTMKAAGFILASVLLVCCGARADLSFVLTPNDQIGTATNEMTFSGALTNTGST